MDGECINCGEVGNLCKCEEEQQDEQEYKEAVMRSVSELEQQHATYIKQRSPEENRKSAEQILRLAIQEIMFLGFHITIPIGEPSPRTGYPLTSVKQVVLVPVPEEYKRKPEL